MGKKNLFLNWVVSIDVYRTISRLFTEAKIANILLPVYGSYFHSQLAKSAIGFY